MLAFLAVYVLWGSTYLAIRFAIETVPPFVMAGARFVVAGAILYAWMRWRGASAPRPSHWRGATVVGGLLLLMGNGGVVWAEQRVASGLAAVLIAVVPFWMVLFDWLHADGTRPGLAVLLGLVAGFAGVALLIVPGEFAGAGHVDPLGAAALLFASVSWATGSLYSRRAPQPASLLLAAAMQMLVGGALLLAAGTVTGEWARLDLGAVSVRSVLSMGYLVLFGSIVGFSCYTWLLKATTPARVATYAYVNPAVAMLLGWGLGGEPLSSRALLAVAVIVGAVVVITTARARRGSRAAEPVAPSGAAETVPAGVEWAG